MNLSNGTPDVVDYDQTGGDPLPQAVAASQKGQLQPSGDEGSSVTFKASGSAPYMVTFVDANDESKTATSCEFNDSQATVTLNDNWTIDVSSGCN